MKLLPDPISDGSSQTNVSTVLFENDNVDNSGWPLIWVGVSKLIIISYLVDQRRSSSVDSVVVTSPSRTTY